MPRLTLGDRFAAAVVGVVFGAIVGLALAWIFGVYSNTLGPSRMPVDLTRWVALGAGGFGLAGLLLGPFVGTLLGLVLSGIWHFEAFDQARERRAPAWLVLVFFALIVGGMWWSRR